MELLFIILFMVAIARFGGGLLERMRLPSLLGELLAGVLLGLVLLVSPWEGVQVLNINESPFFKGLLDVATFMIMFMAGLEVSLRSLLRASRTGVPVAVTGAVLPFGLGLLVGWAFIPESDVKLAQTFFLGVALSITAVPVSIRVLMDLGLLRSRVGIIIVNAAVIDAVVGVVLLGIMVAMLSSGAGPSAGHILLMLGRLALFLGLSIPIALLVVPFIDIRLPKARAGELHFSIILGFGLALAVLSEALGLHFIIGAFLGGLLLADGIRHSLEEVRDIEEKIRGITLGLLAPIFFVSIGLHIDLTAFRDAFWFTVVLLAVAILGKVLGCGGAARLTGLPWRESLAIGVGMNGRGAVELVIATIALNAGLFAQPIPVPPVVAAMFSAVVTIALITTLMAPIGLRLLLGPQEVQSA